MTDFINHPPYYKQGGIEVIDAIEAWDLNFRLANVIKYIVRAGKKNPNTRLEDLAKTAFYLSREITKSCEQKKGSENDGRGGSGGPEGFCGGDGSVF